MAVSGEHVVVDADDLRTTAIVVDAMSRASSDSWAVVRAAVDELGARWQGARADAFEARGTDLIDHAVRVLTALDAIPPQLVKTLQDYASTEADTVAALGDTRVLDLD